MVKPTLAVVCAAAVLVSLAGCKNDRDSGSTATPAGGAAPSAKVNPAPLQAQAMVPPPATAQKATSIGKGSMAVNTSNGPGDTDSFWVASFDIDGDGDFETTQFLWDDEDKVLFAYAEEDVACGNGGTASVQVLAGVNGVGNQRGRQAGSGFFAMYFDASECSAQTAGLFGCRFDAKGNVTGWAAVVVDSAGDEIDAIGN